MFMRTGGSSHACRDVVHASPFCVPLACSVNVYCVDKRKLRSSAENESKTGMRVEIVRLGQWPPPCPVVQSPSNRSRQQRKYTVFALASFTFRKPVNASHRLRMQFAPRCIKRLRARVECDAKPTQIRLPFSSPFFDRRCFEGTTALSL